jgi:fibronectin-binding autotransporter adhesin
MARLGHTTLKHQVPSPLTLKFSLGAFDARGFLFCMLCALPMCGTVRAQETVTYTDGETNSTSYTIYPPNDPLILTIASGSAIQSGILKDTGSSPSGALVKDGAGAVTLTAVETYGYTTTINAGTLALGTGGGIADSSGLTLANNGASFDISSGGNQTIQVLSGVSGSTVNLGANTLTVAPPGGPSNGPGTFAGSIQGSGGFAKTNTGTLVLSGTNTYTGSTAVSAGMLQFAQEGSLYDGQSASWTAAHISVASGATLAVNAGGTGEFTASDVTTLLQNLGSGTGGFANGSALGIDTTNASGGNLTYNGAITDTHSGSDSLSLVKLGTGTLTLNGTNTYSGATTITEGTLQLNGSTSAASTVNIGTAGTLDGSGTVKGNATLTGNGAILLNTGSAIAGTLNVAGGNWEGLGSVTGAVTVSSGTFALPAEVSLTASGGLNVTGSGTLNALRTSTITGSLNDTSSGTSFADVIAGAGNTVTMNNPDGQLTLTGASTYTGATTVTAGILFIEGTTSAASTATVGPNGILYPGGGGEFNGNVNLNGGQLTMDSGTIGGNLTITGGKWEGGNGTVNGTVTVISGNFLLDSFSAMTAPNGVVVSGGTISTGTQENTLTGSLTYTSPLASTFGAEILGSSSLTVDNASANFTMNGLGNYTGPTTVQAGTLTLNSAISSYSTVEVDSGASLLGTGTVNGNLNVFGGTIGLTGIIGGTVTVTGGATFNSAGVSIYGPIDSDSGTLTIGNGASIQEYYGLNVIGGTLVAGNASSTIVGCVNYTSNSSSSFGGVIAGTSSALTMNQAGSTLTLTNANTYAGPTTVTAGTLQVTGSLAAGSAVSIGTAGTLTGTGTINGNVTVTGNGVINLTGSGNIASYITASGGNWNGQGSVAQGITVANGTFTIGAGANLTAPTYGIWVGTDGTLAAGSSTSTLTGSVTYASTSSSNFEGVIAGAGNGITLGNLEAIFTLSGTNSNTYTGLTSVTGGELDLDKTGGAVAVPGNLSIDAGGSQEGGTLVKLVASNQFAPTSGISITGFGQLELNGQSSTVASLTLANGSISSSTPGGNLTVTGTATFSDPGILETGATVTCVNPALVDSLTLQGTLAGAVTVRGDMEGNGKVTGTVTVSPGAALGLLISSPDVNQTLTVGGLNIGLGTLTFNLQASPLASTQMILDTGNLVLNGNTTINIDSNIPNSPLIPGKYTLISTAGALTGNLSDLTLSSISIDGETLALSLSGSSVDLDVQGSQTITFPAIPDQVDGTAPLVLNATASSTLPVTYHVVSGPASIASDMLTITGPGVVTVEADQPGNTDVLAAPAIQQSFMVTEPFAKWEAQSNNFTASQLSDPTISGPAATPEHDGVPNVLKYLYNIDPASSMSALDRAALPVFATAIVNGADCLTLTYRQYAAAIGIGVAVQTSSDLQNWTTLTDPISSQVGTDSNTNDPIVQVAVPISATQQYIRLRVTPP